MTKRYSERPPYDFEAECRERAANLLRHLSVNARETVMGVCCVDGRYNEASELQMVADDLRGIITGEKDPNDLLVECLDGADDESVRDGWTEYVDALCFDCGLW